MVAGRQQYQPARLHVVIEPRGQTWTVDAAENEGVNLSVFNHVYGFTYGYLGNQDIGDNLKC